MQTIAEIYGPFGAEVIAEVQSQLQLHGSMRPLLKALNIPSLPGLDEQHKALVSFLHQFGITVFLHAVREKADPAKVERLKLERRESWHLYTREGSANEAVSPPRTPDSTASQNPPTVSKVIMTPTYNGRDRRATRDRRAAGCEDRRATLEVTFRNRRFGGRDRRHILRRMSDRHFH